MKTISGIHHITAIAGDPQQNIDFYTAVLGLRLVKVTVNFDDPQSYHFYYGDGRGRPGTILTFFSWPGARRGRAGNGQVTAASFAVPNDSLEFWKDRLAENRISSELLPERFGQPVLAFADPDGLRLELIETPDPDPKHLWNEGGVAPRFAIHGFQGATLAEADSAPTATLLTDTMGYRLIGQEQNRFRYAPAQSDASAGRTLDVIHSPGAAEGRVAVGAIHHIAFRTPDDPQQAEWLETISGLGYGISPVMDRVYFHSIYYREPGGILFEIATDSPGFAVDEPPEHLGEQLRLPPWFEPQRSRIEAALQPIQRHSRDQVAAR